MEFLYDIWDHFHWPSLVFYSLITISTYWFLQLCYDAWSLGTAYYPAAHWYPYFLADSRYNGYCWCFSDVLYRYWSEMPRIYWWFTHPITYEEFQRLFYPAAMGRSHCLARWQREFPHLQPEPFNHYVDYLSTNTFWSLTYLELVHTVASIGQTLVEIWYYCWGQPHHNSRIVPRPLPSTYIY